MHSCMGLGHLHLIISLQISDQVAYLQTHTSITPQLISKMISDSQKSCVSCDLVLESKAG